ncbi:hypothetical protein Taro_055873 [Colocasia esculenta]|uniref:Uncharacterized protein n=1 Tax=Colocasia esculenta TaxID=4460 RepID=A0A843XVK1_COLES|nr:hypothetical protein [Colocasia esculenta]
MKVLGRLECKNLADLYSFYETPSFLDCVDLSTDPLLLSTDTHRARQPELCLLLSVDSPFLAVDRYNADSNLGQDLLLHQVEDHWEALTDAARELYHGVRVEQQAPQIETVIDLTRN